MLYIFKVIPLPLFIALLPGKLQWSSSLYLPWRCEHWMSRIHIVLHLLPTQESQELRALYCLSLHLHRGNTIVSGETEERKSWLQSSNVMCWEEKETTSNQMKPRNNHCAKFPREGSRELRTVSLWRLKFTTLPPTATVNSNILGIRRHCYVLNTAWEKNYTVVYLLGIVWGAECMERAQSQECVWHYSLGPVQGPPLISGILPYGQFLKIKLLWHSRSNGDEDRI